VANQARGQSPTDAPPRLDALAPALARNIRDLASRREREEAQSSWQERLIGRITNLTGSLAFAYTHLLLFGFWILANLGDVPGIPSWDPSFTVLAMFASVEAIFLSTFVLISQNRMAAIADKRADLDLQISLLTEHELTKMAAVVSQIAHRLAIDGERKAELEEVANDVAPTAVLDEIEAASTQR